MHPLPIRIAHPRRPQLEYLDDDYFRLLADCGYQGLYLQDSPFDAKSGNHGPFKRTFHLIYLYDIARGPERQRYVDYINTVCDRAAHHGMETHLNCWEPRLPFSAWSETPAHWRGHGGFHYGGRWNFTSLCWSVPAAVAYWRQMAIDAFAALPGIAGVHLGVVDNEANFCDESCPRCRGKTMAKQLEDIYATFAEVKAARPNFRIAIYDWWLPAELLDRLPGIVGSDALIIGRSSQGHRQDGLHGEVEDMTMIMDGCGPGIIEKRRKAERLGLRLVDMPAWSHPNEAFFLPPPPDPLHALNKLAALRELGASGWYDYDCGSTEPGSVADAIAAWTADPDAGSEVLSGRVLTGIFGDDAERAAEAYTLFRKSKVLFPIAHHDPDLFGGSFSGRSAGLGTALFAPFKTTDLRFLDSGHAFHWLSLFNLITPTSIAVLGPRLAEATQLCDAAWQVIRRLPLATPRAVREADAFEIYHRHYRAMRNYISFAEIRLHLMEGRIDAADAPRRIAAIATDELDNLAGTEAWIRRNPGEIGNPCHHLDGWLADCWPDDDFSSDQLGPKRRSLQSLVQEAVV